MPQFEMPFRDSADCDAFGELDGFTQGYIEAIFFTEGGDGEAAGKTFADLTDETLATIKQDCTDFRDTYGDDLAAAYGIGCYGERQAGVDFWLSRNGHGAGYFDRGLGSVGDSLHKAAKLEGSLDLHVGDDGKLYLA